MNVLKKEQMNNDTMSSQCSQINTINARRTQRGPLTQVKKKGMGGSANEKAIMNHARLKGLASGYINVWICKRDMATQNDGHPSSDHDLMCKTSSANPH